MKQNSFIAVLLCLMGSLFLSGCHTVRGFGEDISGSANYVEKKMSGNDDVPANGSTSNPPQWPK